MGVVARTLLVVVLATLAPGVVWLTAVPSTPAPPFPPAPSPPSPESHQPFGPIGLTGCAAAACHGQPIAGLFDRVVRPDCWKSSLLLWVSGDPHARAYLALESDLGRRIMARLREADKSLPESATEYDRCLACHTNPTLAARGAFGLPDETLTRLRAEGVGCESCHGNAGEWITAHTVRTGQHAPTGLASLNDIGVRAAACVGCHVGAPAGEPAGFPLRDMNHDMIAVGHPRLHFDLTEFTRRLPPHWFERDRSTGTPRGPEFGPREWFVGRVAAAEAACALLADRAGRASQGSAPWPEFAEFNCFACHHALAPQSWRQAADGYYAARKPGAMPWQTVWPITRPDEFEAALPAEPQAHAVADAVRALLAGFAPTHPPRAEAAAPLAQDAKAKLYVLRLSLASAEPGPPVGPLFAAAPLDRLNWDEAWQIALGLGALERGRRAEPMEIDGRLGTLQDRLSLPRLARGQRWDSPYNYSPEQVRAELQALIETLTKNPNVRPNSRTK